MWGRSRYDVKFGIRVIWKLKFVSLAAFTHADLGNIPLVQIPPDPEFEDRTVLLMRATLSMFPPLPTSWPLGAGDIILAQISSAR